METKRAPTFIEVPAGTPPSQCKSCRAVIYWIRTKNDRPMPVDCAVDGAAAPTKEESGQGVSHFATCPYGNSHRRPR